MNNGQIVISLLLGILGLLQTFQIYILTDMKQRIMRLETIEMQRKIEGG